MPGTPNSQPPTVTAPANGFHLAAFFAGVGGLDLGFTQAGFSVDWANEYDKRIHPSYAVNFPHTQLDTRSIVDVNSDDLPGVVDGMIGGPPCQSWSEAGAQRGIEDHRGQLFFEYVRLIDAKRPLFFLAENVSGILFKQHNAALDAILSNFSNLGYNVSFGLLNANHYGVPQDRERTIIVGYQTHVGKFFLPPEPLTPGPVLRDTIWDLRDTAVPARDNTYANANLTVPNHEYLVMGYSPMFMSRNRVRTWDQPSFTIQAGGRQAPLHPQAPPMVRIDADTRVFAPGAEHLYRRLTVREAARIQTFPDTHQFVYTNVNDGYRMVGNAVAVEFARRLATQIGTDLHGHARADNQGAPAGEIRSFRELSLS